MKKRILHLLVAIVCFGNIASAQFYAGARVGGNISQISTPSLIDILLPEFQYLPGFNFGITGEYAFNEHFSLLSEMNYQEKGFRIRENMNVDLFKVDIPLGVRVDTRVRYLDLPVMAKYRIGSGPVKAYIAAGPQISYALNGRIKTRADALFEFDLTNISINFSNVNYRRFDVGGVVMAGVDIPAGNGLLFLDARYSQGFNDSFKLPVIEMNIRNHSFGFGIGYKMAF